MSDEISPFEPRKVIVLFGDSHTCYSNFPSGWATHLNQKYHRTVDILTRGYPGYTSLQAEHTLRKHVGAGIWPKGDLYIVFFGTNDSALPEIDPIFSVEPAKYRQSLLRILDTLKTKYDSPRILLITPPPIDRVSSDAFLVSVGLKPGRFTNSAIEKYVNVVVEIGEEQNIPVVNMYEKMKETENLPSFLCDGIHFSDSGNALMFNEVARVVEREFPEWQEAVMKIDAPAPFEYRNDCLDESWEKGHVTMYDLRKVFVINSYRRAATNAKM